jgi:hypothetical protein
MKIAKMLPGLVLLVLGTGARAGDAVPSDPYDDYTSRMLQAYKKEQASCGVAGRELDCLVAQFESELIARGLDTLQEPRCASGADCKPAPANFWGR